MMNIYEMLAATFVLELPMIPRCREGKQSIKPFASGHKSCLDDLPLKSCYISPPRMCCKNHEYSQLKLPKAVVVVC